MDLNSEAQKYGATFTPVAQNTPDAITPSVNDFNSLAQRYGATFTPETQQTNTSQTTDTGSPYGAVGNALSDFSTGVAKTGIETANKTGQLVESGLQKVGGFFQRMFGYKPTLENAGVYNTPRGEEINQMTQAQGTAESIGKIAGTVAPYIAGAGELKTIEGLLDTAATNAIKSPGLAQTALKIGSKAALEAGVGGATTLAQTGDPKQALTAALTFGALKGTGGAFSETLKSMGVPEHLYSTIFKTSSNDMLQELKTGGIANLQKTNPTMFKSLVDNGIIHTAADGTYQVDETLAKQALDQGLRGNIKNMSNVVVKNTLQNESDARSLAASYGKTITIPSPNKLGSVLDTVAAQYKDVGQGEIAAKAADLSAKVKTGEVGGKDALDLRRFLDSMRFKSSYNPEVKLSTTAENFKYWSDLMRGKLNAIPGMQKVMDNYSFNIDALNALANTAAKRGNSQLINMLDVLVFEGGIQGGSPGIGAGMSLTRKALTTPSAATGLGQAIQKSGTVTPIGLASKATVANTINGAANPSR